MAMEELQDCVGGEAKIHTHAAFICDDINVTSYEATY